MKLYHQKNRLFKNWFLLTYLPIAILLFAHYRQHPEELSIYSLSFWGISLALLAPLCFLLALKLELNADASQISYRFFPIHWKYRSISWDSVQSARLVKFNAVRHYWGYGYRHTSKYGKGLIVQGNIGLLIIDGSGKRINIEITDQPGFERFVREQNLGFVDLNVVRLEETI